MRPYELIADLAQRELELVTAGALDELPALHRERAAVLAALPPSPPPAAGPLLERAAATQAKVTAALDGRMRALAEEMTRLGRGTAAVLGYKPPVVPQRRFDHRG
jgi:hypothetical protein